MKPDNRAVAQLFDDLGSLLELQGQSAFLATGQLPALERKKEKVPATLLDLLRIGGVGPKRAARFWKEMGITDLPGLETAAKEGRLRTMKGKGPGGEGALLSGVAPP